MEVILPDAEDQPTFERTKLKYAPSFGRFIVRNREDYFGRQFNSIYVHRLERVAHAVVENARKKWGDREDLDSSAFVTRVLDVESGKLCVVVGTAFRKSDARADVLKGYAAEMDFVPRLAVAPVGSVIGEKDQLVLEDGGGRIPLIGASPMDEVVTGAVIGVLGKMDEDGAFDVEEWCMPEMAPQRPLGIPEEAQQARGYIALVSGLGFDNANVNPLPLALLADFLTGHGGSSQEVALAASISRLVVAGGLLTSPVAGKGMAAPPDARDKVARRAHQERISGPLCEADAWLAQIASSMPVDVMPGMSDPSNFVLPQQPFRRGLFPLARRFASVQMVTNPYEFRWSGMTVLGTSGQSVDDMKSCMAPTPVLDMLEKTLRWRHVAPTAPDSLSCYPFYDQDPFVMPSTPHLYFAGCQKKLEHRLVTDNAGTMVRVVALPSFDQTGTVVLVNVATLECRPLTFSVDTMV